MKKALMLWCGVLALGVMLCACAQAKPQEAAEPETKQVPEAVDVLQTAPPEPDYLQHEAYMTAPRGFFEPDRKLTRAAAAQLVCNLAGLDTQRESENAFADVGQENWYYDAVCAAAEFFTKPEEHAALPAPEADEAQQGADAKVRYFRPRDAALAYELRDALARALDLPDASLPEGIEEMTVLTRAGAARLVNHLLGRTPDAALREISYDLLLDVPRESASYYEILEAVLPHAYEAGSAERWDPDTPGLTKLRAGAHTLDGAGFVVGGSGCVVRQEGLFDEDGWTYLAADETGRIFADGALHLYEGSVYYAARGGQLLKNTAMGAYLFDENGRYTTGRENVDKLLDEAIGACTTEDMTQAEMLRACYDYVRDFKYLGRNAAYGADVKTPPYENLLDFAEKILSTGKGDCYNFAASFCLLARRLGFEAECIIGTCGYVWNWRPIAHGWVEITQNGQTLLYDPQIENYNLRAGISNETNGAYAVRYETAHAQYLKN